MNLNPDNAPPEQDSEGKSCSGLGRPTSLSDEPGRKYPDVIGDALFLRRALLVAALLIASVFAVTLIRLASDIFLLLFCGILFAVLLRAPTNWLVRHAGLSESAALGFTIIAFVALIAALAWLFSVPISQQIGQLADTLPEAMVRVRQWTQQYYWAKPLAALASDVAKLRLDLQLLGRATGVISSTLQGIISVVVVLFIGFYLAAQPRLYQQGFLKLFPLSARSRAREVLDQIGHTLRLWLLGRFITMVLVGSAAGLGLWALDIPFAFALGLVSGLLEFVPYLGPILATVPALLIAFNIGPTEAFYVLLLFVAIQSAENYLLSPLVEQRAVSLPPALVIFSTLLLATFFGTLGVIVASPLTAVCIVAVKLLVTDNIAEREERT